MNVARLPMRIALVAALALANTAFAQDKVTLANGDVLTGTIKTMADGKLTITSPVLGDVVVEFAKIKDIATQEQVRVLTSSGRS